MDQKNVFITGGTGCVGRYVLDFFENNPAYHCHLLVRNPKKLPAQILNASNMTIHQGDMKTIDKLAPILKKMTYLIHIATDWSDSEYATTLNVVQTHKMFSFCDPDRCQKIIYFSTASILGKGNRPIIEAETKGTGYVRSKYRGYMGLKDLAIASKIVTVFPTLVFGGDQSHPYSHLSGGLIPSLGYAKLIRFFYMDARFHFLHAKDIASLTYHFLETPLKKNAYVFGTPVITGKSAIETICQSFGIPIYFRIKIPAKFLMALARLLRIQISPWDRHCIEQPFFEYDVVAPDDFGIPTAFPTLRSVLEDLKAQKSA